MLFQGLDLRAKMLKVFACLMTFVMVSLLWMTQPVPAGATDQSNDGHPAADQLEIWIGYSGDSSKTYYPLRTFQQSELESMKSQHIYTFIDNLPCTIVDPAEGVELTELLAECDIDENEVKNFRFWTSDVPGMPYQTLTKEFLLDTHKYYFPNITDDWELVEGGFYDPVAGYGGSSDIYFPDSVHAAAYAEEVPTMLAFRDKWQRVFSATTGALPGDTSFSGLVDAVRYRLVFGHPGNLGSANPEHTASRSAKWVYRMDITMEGSPPAATGVALDKATAAIKAGSSEQLTAIISPSYANQSVTWSSSDTAVATVSATGLVTAVSPGTATITVTTAGSGFTATCAVTVSPATGGSGSVTGVELNKTSQTITIGGSFQLTATVSPSSADQSVTWSSSDTSVATVSVTGLVTAVSPGSATITVTTADGGFTATCAVTVRAATAAATGVSLNKSAATIKPGATEQLIAKVNPDNANQGVTWSSSNTAVATVGSDGMVTAVAEGSAIITATTTDGGFTATCAVTVTTKNEPAGPNPPGDLNDVSGHWAENNIKQLVEQGVISGYPDGSFLPDNTITRAEFVVILVKAFSLDQQEGKVFGDTAGHWAKDYIATITSYGVVSGYDDSAFGPDDPITREQMAVMIVKAAGLSPAAGETEIQFSDSSGISAWAMDAVVAATTNGIMKGYPDNTFKPQGNATRAEAVTVVINALNK